MTSSREMNHDRSSLPIGFTDDVAALLAADDPVPHVDRMNDRLRPLWAGLDLDPDRANARRG
jgi:hypothetical protein